MDISSLRERRSAPTFTVGELNNYIKSVIENDRALAAVTVRGEISNFVAHTSGHLYFSLKDDSGQIKAVMFRSSVSRLKFVPENGMRVTAHGSVSVYPQGGTYQLYVNSLTPDGIGELYLMYEQLKKRLSEEGLFDEGHKKPIPSYPRAVGVITSPTGAAVRDIINVTGRRFPFAKIYLYPSLVQGNGAEEGLVRALDYFEKSGLADVIIIGRGGGSIEDLWAFNSEKLARKIYAHPTPIISAVGHETDFTICDFVSDMRAPTPSAAAEIAVPDSRQLLLYTDSLLERAVCALNKNAKRAEERLNYLKNSKVFVSPETVFEVKRHAVSQVENDLSRAVEKKLSGARTQMELLAQKLEALSPLSVLSRGYLVAQHDGKTVKSIKDVGVGDEISVRLTDGTLKAEIKEKSADRKQKRSTEENGS